MKKGTLFFTLAAVLSLFSVVLAATLTGTTFGEATDLGGGTFKLVSDESPGFGGINYDTPDSFMFSDINMLRVDQTPEPDDTCVGGSPRFQLNVDTDGDGDFDGNVFVHTEFAGCPGDTGNLAEVGGSGETAGTFDLSQIGGPLFSTYSDALAFFEANPDFRIIGIQLVVDSGWAFSDGEQTITVTPTVGLRLPQPPSANACKKGGWQMFEREDGTAFRNQGDCVSYFASDGKAGSRRPTR